MAPIAQLREAATPDGFWQFSLLKLYVMEHNYYANYFSEVSG